MAVFNGQLSIIGNQSNLDAAAADFLLVMAGISDPAQAIFAATQFLVKVRKLHSGQMINVTGSSGSTGTVSIISMTDASPAAPEAALAAGFESVTASRSATAKKKSRKRATKTKKRPRKSAKK